MRFMVISDTHLGRRQYGLELRERDMFEAFRYCLKMAADSEVETVLHCGDLFDSQRPRNRVMEEVLKAVEEFGVQLVVIPGNHDFGFADSPPASLISMMEDYVLLLGGTREKPAESCVVNDCNIIGVRYLGPVEFKNWNEIRETVQRLIRPDMPNILLLHQTWHRAFGMDVPCVLEDKDLPGGVDFVFFGHVHSPFGPVNLGDTVVLNVGSTEVLDYREAGKPKLLWSLENGKLSKRVIPTVRPFIAVEKVADLAKLENVSGKKKPVVILKNKKLEGDVLAYEPLKIIRCWNEEGVIQSERFERAVGIRKLDELVERAVSSDRPSLKEAVKHLVLLAMQTGDEVDRSELMERVEREIAEVLASEGAGD